MTQAHKVSEPLYAAEAISEEIEKLARFCKENPLVQDLVPMWTLVSNGMQITWAMLLLERSMKQLLCFDGKGGKVRNNHDVQQPYSELDNRTKTYIEKAFDAYLMLYPSANWKGYKYVPTSGYVDINAAQKAHRENPGKPVEEFYQAEPTAVYKSVGSLMSALSSQKRYDMWRYPEFHYPNLEMDMTNVHLILEIATAVSDVLLSKVRDDGVSGYYLVGKRLEESYMNAFDEKLNTLIRRLDESGNDTFQIMPANEIELWQKECGGGFFAAFVDYLLNANSVDVYRHEGLNEVLDNVVHDIASSKELEDVDMQQFLKRVQMADFDLNVLMMR